MTKTFVWWEQINDLHNIPFGRFCCPVVVLITTVHRRVCRIVFISMAKRIKGKVKSIETQKKKQYMFRLKRNGGCLSAWTKQRSGAKTKKRKEKSNKRQSVCVQPVEESLLNAHATKVAHTPKIRKRNSRNKPNIARIITKPVIPSIYQCKTKTKAMYGRHGSFVFTLLSPMHAYGVPLLCFCVVCIVKGNCVFMCTIFFRVFRCIFFFFFFWRRGGVRGRHFAICLICCYVLCVFFGSCCFSFVLHI